MQVRIAVIGCGYWGINLVRNFADLGALVAVADVNSAAAEGAASRFSVPARGVDDILADPDIDGVVLAVPAALHAAVALESLRSGKDVFVEKPLALELREAQEVCETAAAKDRVLMVGHLLQYHPAFLRLRTLAREGELGKLQYVYSNRLNFGRIRREENSLWSFAPHDLSMILSLVGSPPSGVFAVGSSYLQHAVADTTTTHLRFPGGESAHVHVSWLHPFKEQKLVVVGDRGMAVFDDGQPWERKLLVYRHHIEWRDGLPVPSKAEPEPVEIEQAEPLKLECEHFLECVRTRAVPRTDGAEGLAVLSVLAAAERSMRSGMEERLDQIGTGAKPFVHESAYVDAGAELGARTRVWHFSHVLGGSVIGADCVLGQNVMIGPDVRVGDHCKIQNNVSLYKGVTLEDGVFCGPSAVFTNVNNPRAEIERKSEFRPTHVGRGATIGANATIVCGHRIGAYSFIAAGAVVTSDVPDHALVAGVPAKRIGWVSHDGERLGPALVCPRSGRRYREVAGQLLEAIADGE